MTVVMRGGTRYGADAIKACETEEGLPGIVFICSGRVTEVRAEDVERIEVRDPEGSGLCMTCGGAT